VVGDQFSQVKVCTERDADCAVSLRISCHPCLQPIEKKDRQPSISWTVPYTVITCYIGLPITTRTPS